MENEAKAWQMQNFLGNNLKSKQVLRLFRLFCDGTFKHRQFRVNGSIVWIHKTEVEGRQNGN